MRISYRYLLFLAGLSFVIAYGVLEAVFVNKMSAVMLTGNGFVETLSRVAGSFFSFFSGFLLWLFISIVTSVFYEVVFILDVNKVRVYSLTAVGFVIMLLSLIPSFYFLNKLSGAIETSVISMSVIQDSLYFRGIKITQAVSTSLYYLFIWFLMSREYKEEGAGVSLKFLGAVLVIIFVQFFVLGKIK